jgi:hypothetical protein
MMKLETRQHGSIRKFERSQGFAWEFNFYTTAPGGKRKLQVRTFPGPTHINDSCVAKAGGGFWGIRGYEESAEVFCEVTDTRVERNREHRLEEIRPSRTFDLRRTHGWCTQSRAREKYKYRGSSLRSE